MVRTHAHPPMADQVDGLGEMIKQLRGRATQWEPVSRPDPKPAPDFERETGDAQASLEPRELGFYDALQLDSRIPREVIDTYRKQIKYYDDVVSILRDGGQVVPDEMLGWKLKGVPPDVENHMQEVTGQAATLVEGEWVPGRVQDKGLHEVAIAPFSITAAVKRIEDRKNFDSRA